MGSKFKMFIPHATILLVGVILFRNILPDFLSFLVWWLCFVVLGVIFLPVTGVAFGKFKNCGYMFSKALCLAAAGYLQWLLTSLRILPFRVWACFLVVLLVLALNFLVNRKTKTWQRYIHDGGLLRSASRQEALFLGLLLFWTFIRALRPELDDLEKFMDFGFVNALLRSDWLPAPDMWLAGEGINYYYLGQFFSAFVTKLTFIDAAVAYNLMMATLFALAFMLSYSVVEFLVEIYQKNTLSQDGAPKGSAAGAVAGVIAGLAVCVAGNLHALVYAVLFPHRNVGASYWFPNATRYIGYNPDVPYDKTIHEFPLYSFVVSDLHAHVINLLFVLTVVGLAVSLAVDVLGLRKGGDISGGDLGRPPRFALRKWAKASFFLIIFLIGLFPAINFWDYPIYIVFAGALLLYANLRVFDYSLKSLLVTVGQLIVVAVAAYIVTLPFHLTFDTMGVEIKLVEHRSMLYQLGVLWGWQLCFAGFLTYMMVRRYRRQFFTAGGVFKKRKGLGAPEPDGEESALYIPRSRKDVKLPLFRFMENVNPADAFVFIFFICATGLFIIPELIYVADIYPTHPRANTMFKLGYQSFVLFGLGAGYTFVRIIHESKAFFKHRDKMTVVCSFLLASALLYPPIAIVQRYGNPLDFRGNPVIGLDGTAYMLTHEKPYTGANGETVLISLRDDHALIQYLNENIKGSPVIAEAYGASYTLNGRISANTGLPNIINWNIHQLLWRNSDHEMIDGRRADVNALYESGDPELVRGLIEKYDIEFIVIGEIERLRYPNLDEALLKSMGESVLQWNDLYLVILASGNICG